MYLLFVNLNYRYFVNYMSLKLEKRYCTKKKKITNILRSLWLQNGEWPGSVVGGKAQEKRQGNQIGDHCMVQRERWWDVGQGGGKKGVNERGVLEVGPGQPTDTVSIVGAREKME